MRAPFSFEGEIRPVPYAIASTALFSSQHLVVAALFATRHEPLIRGWRFFLFPLRSVGDLNQAPTVYFALGMAFSFLIAWALAVLAFRRATDAGLSGWVAALVFAPVLQIIVVACLAIAPPRRAPVVTAEVDKPPIDWATAVQGMLAGMAVTLLTVVVGALIVGSYGYGMFVVGPFLIGATTAYIANRTREISEPRTMILALCAAGLGGVALIAVALEGAICILLASPFAALLAGFGSFFGRSIARSAQAKAKHSMMSIAILPMVFSMERAFPPSETFETSQYIEVAAQPAAVWRSLIHMDAITGRPGLPFRLGVAYPVSATIIGSGVGARRVGVFSTGVAVETVTEWQANRLLAFDVLSDPPAMREMSPYRHVNAPHVVGYFHTALTRFELTPLPNGHTRVALWTTHELKLDPVLYWLPMARWVVNQDDRRVLNYLRSQSERAAAAGVAA
jgi:hypothetical protein